jgi:signal transduction histidine kinase
LQVCDDGCGYDLLQQQKGLGIFGMRERAALLGGSVETHSQPGKGTTVEAIVPLPAREGAAHE